MKLLQRKAFVDRPWATVGKDVAVDGLVTVEEALEKGGLDWDVRIEPLYRVREVAGMVSVDGVSKYARSIVREDNGVELASVGGEYHAIQNRKAFMSLNDIVGGREAMIKVVGMFGDGQQSWMSAKLPNYIDVEGTDLTFEHRLFISNAHTGKQAFQIGFNNVCVVCWNTYQAALEGLVNKVSIRHTSNFELNLEDVRNSLRLASKYFGKLDMVLNGFAKAQWTQNDVDEVVMKLIPDSGKDGPMRFATDHDLKIRDRMKALYETAIGNDLNGVGGTALAMAQATTQYADHERGTMLQGARFKSAMTGTGAKFKEQSFEIIREHIEANR